MDNGRGEPLAAPVWAIVKIAEVAADTYEAMENPSRAGYECSSDAVLEWFPKLRAALNDAGLLYDQ